MNRVINNWIVAQIACPELRRKVQCIIQDSSASPPQKSEDWIERRKLTIGGSEIADAMGIGYRGRSGRYDLIKRKVTGIRNFWGNINTRWGEYYEDVAINRYSQETGYKVMNLNLIHHQTCDWLAFSPDGLAVSGDGRDVRLIEVKCPRTREIVPGQIPHYYVPQIQLGLWILRSFGLKDPKCDFIQFKPLGPETDEVLDITTVEPDEKWQQRAKIESKMTWTEILRMREEYARNPDLFASPKKIVNGKYGIEIVDASKLIR